MAMATTCAHPCRTRVDHQDGKSTYVEQLADLLEVQLHIINVSRLSPSGDRGCADAARHR